jgi:phage terminase Nu1 subunit (DNA packaging protein)
MLPAFSRNRGRARRRGAAAEVASERAALLKTQRQRAEFQLAQEVGKWVELTDVEANWANALRTLRSGVLTIPTRVAARVPGMTREMLYEMDQELREILTELARNGYPEPVVEIMKTTP